jgi:thiamine biosynthesis lipoprotein
VSQGLHATPRTSAALPCFLVLALGCSGPQQRQAQPAEEEVHGFVLRQSREIMSTTFEVTVAAGPDDDPVHVRAALESALDEVSRIEQAMSPYREDSEISRVNAAAGGDPVVVSAELFGLVERAVALCHETGGALDISFMPLGRLWDFRAEPFTPPGEEAIARARALVGCDAIELDPEVGTLRLPREGMAIGLGAVAKGYAVDRASSVLSGAGWANHLVNGGGDVLGRGAKPDGPWVVGIRDPRGDRGALIGRMPLRDQAMVTSGDYERFVEFQGVRYHHIIDPRTGRPAGGLASVTVVDDSAERADALATALLVAGPEQAGPMALRLGVETLLVTEAGQAIQTQGLTGRVELDEPAAVVPSAARPEDKPVGPGG